MPSRKECMAILSKNKTPSNVIEHCKTVCKVAEDVANKLIKSGVKVNRDLVVAAALLHDVERLKDNHVIKGKELVAGLGYPEVATTMSKHSLFRVANNEPKTTEEKIVFYADKRVMHDKVVSMEERYREIKERYNLDLKWELEYSKKIEKELLG